jgi:hypothetical protein
LTIGSLFFGVGEHLMKNFVGGVGFVSFVISGLVSFGQMPKVSADDTSVPTVQSTATVPTDSDQNSDSTQKKKKKKKKAAQDQNASGSSTTNTGSTSNPGVKLEGPAVGTEGATGAPSDAELNTNRLKTLEGSKSRWSGQLNFTYQGSSVSHPFDSIAGNPLGQTNPYPVNLQGTVAVRYRLDSQTTVGLGTGIYIEKPFADPQNGSVSNPQLDLAHTFKFWNLHNYADFLINGYTDHNYHDVYGYDFGATASDDISYGWKNGITVGTSFQADFNIFGAGAPEFSLSGQDLWDLNFYPYFEYKINDTFNIRTLLGFQYQHIRDSAASLALDSLPIYNSTGLGIQVFQPLYVYVFAQFTPFNGKATWQNNWCGFNVIYNLF